MALGIPINDLENMAAISYPRLRVLITDWEKRFVDRYDTELIKTPEDEEDIVESDALFNRCGLPGFVLSMGVVHARYDMFPHAQLSNCKGKEGEPTIGYQAHVDHNKLVTIWVQDSLVLGMIRQLG